MLACPPAFRQLRCADYIFVAGTSDSSDAEQDESKDEADDDEAAEDTEETSKSKELAEGYFGVGGAERAWHRQFGTDPYTTNEALRAAIKSVAWADRLGRFSLSFVSVPSVPGADVIGDANDLVWSRDPYELEDYNRGVLVSAGADEALIEAFFDNASLTPTMQTTLIAALASLDGVAGLDHVLARILEIEAALEARIVRDSVLLLVSYHETQRSLERIVPNSPLPSAIDVEGVAIVPVGVDYLTWAPEIAAATDRYVESLSAADAANAEYWSAGKVSARARRELEARGWTVRSPLDMAGTTSGIRR